MNATSMDRPHASTQAITIAGAQRIGVSMARRLVDEGCKAAAVVGRSEEGRSATAALAQDVGLNPNGAGSI